ncbi:MAG: aminotransferase class I/II-fold pyridoxal phosphate-dependent enzyme [Flavobacteriaceae bacterium]|nr:aminotransferase class I/II-fold pyridoxal phosphate-dependent enzyme [Flavobacteriaceae bacterium]
MKFVNPNTLKLKPSATLMINEQIMKLRASGKKVFHFGFGQSPFGVHPKISEALKAHATSTQYLPSLGLPELRANIATYLNNHQHVQAKKEHILIGPGSKELIYQSILLLDGTYIIPRGSWVSYLPQVKLANKKYVLLQTSFHENYKLQAKDLDAFCKSSEAGQYFLLLNSPNNPTGAIYSEDELQDIATICAKFGIIVFSDEIYSQLSYQLDHAPSIASYYPENTLVFGGMSKVFAAGGYRLGFVSIPENLKSLIPIYESMFSETFSAVSAPVQYAALEAYRYENVIQKTVRDSAIILKAIASFTYDFLCELKIKCTKPQGGFYMLIDFGNYAEALGELNLEDSVTLSRFLLEEYQVALLPGTDFYFPPQELIFRLAFVDFDGRKALQFYQSNEKVQLDYKFIQNFAPNVFEGLNRINKFVATLK